MFYRQRALIFLSLRRIHLFMILIEENERLILQYASCTWTTVHAYVPRSRNFFSSSFHKMSSKVPFATKYKQFTFAFLEIKINKLKEISIRYGQQKNKTTRIILLGTIRTGRSDDTDLVSNKSARKIFYVS